jgi:hypothetical protein
MYKLSYIFEKILVALDVRVINWNIFSQLFLEAMFSPTELQKINFTHTHTHTQMNNAKCNIVGKSLNLHFLIFTIDRDMNGSWLIFETCLLAIF